MACGQAISVGTVNDSGKLVLKLILAVFVHFHTIIVNKKQCHVHEIEFTTLSTSTLVRHPREL